MTHTYQVSNITCENCIAKVKGQLLKHPDILSAEVQLQYPQATITMQKHLSVNELQQAIGAESKYRITKNTNDHSHHTMQPEVTQSWLAIYKPLFLIFVFITGVTIIAAYNDGTFNLFNWMNLFMAGFFIVFSFFKLLNLRDFADSYAMYDLLAKKVHAYGFVYPFIELALGLAYLTGFNPMATTITTIIVMGFSSIGVIKSVLSKQQIRCACLGTVFNLPMSTITIIEDLLMVAMALIGHLHYHHI